MDTLDSLSADGAASIAEPRMDPPPTIGNDERRMHVRAYNYWASLLQGREFPSIDVLDPASIGDFGPHGVLLDFRNSRTNPAISWLGRALADEGRHVAPVATLADVPAGSLLSRLSDHYADVVANRAPIGFEAEFDNAFGNHTLYRGILMPFSSDGTTIDYIYGVINWKEVANAALVAGIAAEVARAPAPAARPPVPAWADGPNRLAKEADTPADVDAELLAAAIAGIDLARSTQARAQTALYRALGLAYDLALANEAHAPSGASDRTRRVAALVRRLFATDSSVRQCADYAAILEFGLRTGVERGGLRMLLEREPGGWRALARAGRQTRRNGTTER
ncbi:hypothetical protein ACFSGX_15775 [Sphingomonas arantia]|uniref:Uncharacterized protein n=1 Tax=Sphingomonas arantia TaxID=1460676 RepID=A0ABW4U1N9_9SPHN